VSYKEVLKELESLNVVNKDEKFVINPKIDPLTTKPEEAKAIIEEQINVLISKGISPSNIGIVGVPEEFAEINTAIEDIVGKLGGAFGGALSKLQNLSNYFSQLNGIIDNNIFSAFNTVAAQLPEEITIDQGLVSKYGRLVGKQDMLGNELVSFPDHMLPEERPIDNKTPISDWKDRSAVVAETAGGKKFSEKKSMFKSQYGKNVILKSNGGHFIEMDDSDDGERINIQHKNGTFITLMPDRTIVMRAQNGIQQVTYKDNDLFVKGNLNITVIGDVNISSNGNTNIDTVGDVNWKVGGNFNLDVAGNTSMFNKLGDIKMTAKQIRQNAGDPRVLDDVKEKTYKLGE